MTILLMVISVEGALIILELKKKKEVKVNPRRELTGMFKDPLGDKYRKNGEGLYTPIRPSRGDEEDV